ncbi:MAG: hypothetical protein ACFCVC_17415 [Acidimicrobiia bacterium]
MSDLERDTARAFERFLRQGQELSEADAATIGRWAAKTLVVFMWADLDARKFMSAPGVGAVPDVTLARSVFAGQVPDTLIVAAGRLAAPNAVLWCAGNPDVVTADPNRLNCRVVNAIALNLGLLQLWIIAPLFKPSRLVLPEHTALLLPGTRLESLPITGPNLNLGRATAVFDLPTTATIVREPDQLVKMRA